MTATLEQQALAHGAAHRLSKIDSLNRTARTGAGAAGVKRNRKRRTPVAFPQPRRYHADHAGMPALSRSHHHGALFFEAKRGHGFGLGLLHSGSFDLPAFLIEPIP